MNCKLGGEAKCMDGGKYIDDAVIGIGRRNLRFSNETSVSNCRALHQR